MPIAKWILKRLDHPEEIVLSGQEEFALGRSKDSYRAILSLCVSRRHCIFRISENGVTVRDLNSANGTFVNENKIPPMVDFNLKNSDRIGIGVPIVSGSDTYVFMLVKYEEKLTGNVAIKNEPTEDKNKPPIDDDVLLIEEKKDIDIIDLSEFIKDENGTSSRKDTTSFSSPSGSGLQSSPVDLNATSVLSNSKNIHNKEMPVAVLLQSVQNQETSTKQKTVPCEKINLKIETPNFINPDCERINSDVNSDSNQDRYISGKRGNSSTLNSPMAKKAKLDSVLNSEPNSSSSSSCSVRKNSSCDSPLQCTSESENPDKWFATFSRPFLEQLDKPKSIKKTSTSSSASTHPKGAESVAKDTFELKTEPCAEKLNYEYRGSELCIKKNPVVLLRKIDDLVYKNKHSSTGKEIQCSDKDSLKKYASKTSVNTMTAISVSSDDPSRDSDSEIDSQNHFPSIINYSQSDDVIVIDDDDDDDDDDDYDDESDNLEKEIKKELSHQKIEELKVSNTTCEEICVKEEIFDDEDDVPEEEDDEDETLNWVNKLSQSFSPCKEEYQSPFPPTKNKLRIFALSDSSDEELPSPLEKDCAQEVNIHKDIQYTVSSSEKVIDNLSLESSSKNKTANKNAELETDIQDDEISEDSTFDVLKKKQHEKKNTKLIHESTAGKRNEKCNSSGKKSLCSLVDKRNSNETELNSAKAVLDVLQEQKKKNNYHKNVSNIFEDTAQVKPFSSRNVKTINQPSNRRTTLLDYALPMKTKSRHKITKSSEKNKTADSDEQSTNIAENNTTAMGRNSKDKFKEIQDTRMNSSSSNVLLSDKNRVREDRKAKLKALTAQKCEVTTSNKIESKAPPKSTYRPKNTLLSRADRLAESLVTSNDRSKHKKEKIKVKVVVKKNEDNFLQARNISSSKEKTSTNVEVSSRDRDNSNYVSRTTIPDSTSRTLQANSSVPEIARGVKKLSFKDLPKIPKCKTSDSSSTESHTNVRDKSNKSTKEKLPLRSSLKLNSAHSKKKVSFASENKLCTVYKFQIEEGNTLHRVQGKDAPLKKIIAYQAETLYDSSKIILKRVITQILQFWNPRWIIEESIIAQNGGEPPPAHCQNVTLNALCPMLTSFSNYDEYLRIVEPLMLLDLWAQVSENSRRPNERTKTKYDISINDIKEPNETNGIITLHCSTPITLKQDKEKSHPHVGDLCVMRYPVWNTSNAPHGDYNTKTSQQDKYYERFAYVESLTRDYFRSGNRNQGSSSADAPHCRVNLIIKMKGDSRITLIQPTLKVISSIRADLRTFEAVGFLKHTRLCKMILNPCVADYKLSNIKISSHLVTKDSLNESQKTAVLKCGAACLHHTPKLCLIQGPPGTGKTKVIVNIIRQILYSDDQYSKQRWDKKTRILLCAPSNAAADELVERLLVVRSEMPKEHRFKMVRAGPLEFMREKVRGVSLDELAKKDMDAALAHQLYPLDEYESVQLEISTLEARKRSYVMSFEHAVAKKENTGMYEKKIKEIEKKIIDLKGPLRNVPSAKTAEMEREARRKILSFADIVVSTLSSSFNSQMTEVFASRNGRSTTRFTCCIIDEATQSREPECLIPLMYGIERIIMVGDPEQLPATVLSQVAKGKSFGQSLFNRIWNKFQNEAENPVIFLNTQYRMHPEIYKWPNEYIYNGRVLSHPSAYFRAPFKPYCVFAHSFQQNSQSLVNYSEAILVTDIAKTLAFGFPELLKTIGIITPYQKQLQEIKKHIGESGSSVTILVNTIDGFQGRECDVIIFSCVRTRGLGFMGESQRLNVALTRARISLIICGNFVSLQDDKMWSNLLADAMNRKMVIDAHNKSIDQENILHYLVQR